MKRILSMVAILAITTACGRSGRRLDSGGGSGLASVSIGAPSELKAGTDFDKITVSYLLGSAGDDWSKRVDFAQDKLTDPKLKLKPGSYTFSVELWKGDAKVASTIDGNADCPYARKDLKAGANSLNIPLCRAKPEDKEPNPPPTPSDDVDLTISTTLVERLAIAADPKPKATLIDTLEVSFRLQADSERACKVKAIVTSSIKRDAPLAKELEVVKGAGAKDVTISFTAAELGDDIPSQVELKTSCGDSTWSLASTIEVTNSRKPSY